MQLAVLRIDMEQEGFDEIFIQLPSDVPFNVEWDQNAGAPVLRVAIVDPNLTADGFPRMDTPDMMPIEGVIRNKAR
jgi:hypothetical protein